MEVTFLGTSAANAFPEAFCRCDNCEQARILGGPSLRKRSSLLINDDLLIDLGPDIMTSAQIHGRTLTNVRYCLQTHAHADHLDVSHFLSRSPGFGVKGAPRLHFYASRGSLRFAAKMLARDFPQSSFLDPKMGDRLNLEIHQIESFQSINIGAYQVITFPATHDPGVEPLLFAVREGDRTIFYGTDTAALSEDVWQGFHRFQLRFYLVILDHTYGPSEIGGDHLSAQQVINHVARMRAEGLMEGGARAYATHIAHEGNPPHPNLVDFAAQHDYAIAFDGLTVR
jgi:phosphoribosyl 1,2-cyclic phosphate phosphodiesterase